MTEELALAETALGADGDRRAARRRFAEAVLDHHRRWRVFRASLRALYATDAEVHAARLAQRERQIVQSMALLSRQPGEPPSRARLLATMLGFEALCDAIADGDAAALGVDAAALIELLVEALDALG